MTTTTLPAAFDTKAEALAAGYHQARNSAGLPPYRGYRFEILDTSGPTHYGYRFALVVCPEDFDLPRVEDEQGRPRQFAGAVDVHFRAERRKVGGVGPCGAAMFAPGAIEAGAVAARAAIDEALDTASA